MPIRTVSQGRPCFHCLLACASGGHLPGNTFLARNVSEGLPSFYRSLVFDSDCTRERRVTVPREDLDQCLLLVRAVLEEWPQAKLSFDATIAKLSVRGIGLRSHTGVGETMFRALAAAGINGTMLNTSEILMSVVVDRQDGAEAYRCLNEAFAGGEGVGVAG